MTSEQERLARLEAKVEDLTRRVNQLEDNTRKGVFVLIGLIIKSIFDFLRVGA